MTFIQQNVCSFVYELLGQLYLCALSCVPAVCQHVKGDAQDGSSHSDGIPDVLAGHRANRLAQPNIVLLSQNQSVVDQCT